MGSMDNTSKVTTKMTPKPTSNVTTRITTKFTALVTHNKLISWRELPLIFSSHWSIYIQCLFIHI